jgi:ribosome maturation protein SDO1
MFGAQAQRSAAAAAAVPAASAAEQQSSSHPPVTCALHPQKPKTGQKRLTNVAVVRLKKNGKRFEVACYRNKINDWRAGMCARSCCFTVLVYRGRGISMQTNHLARTRLVLQKSAHLASQTPSFPTPKQQKYSEKDIDEVLQTTTVFANVGKGVHAKREDLVEAFGTADEECVCREILAKGDVQVSDRERRAELDALFKDVAQVLAEKTVNPDNGRPYTHTVLERALRDLHFNPDLKKSAKQQAIEVRAWMCVNVGG